MKITIYILLAMLFMWVCGLFIGLSINAGKKTITPEMLDHFADTSTLFIHKDELKELHSIMKQSDSIKREAYRSNLYSDGWPYKVNARDTMEYIIKTR